MYTYKNVSSQAQSITGVGLVQPGGTLQSEKEFNNKNFELVNSGGVSATADNNQPGQVTEAKQIENEEQK